MGDDDKVKVTRKKLADYIQNPDNPVAHDPRNLGVVVDSIHKVGAFRSGAASKGKILAGNLTWEAMAEAGIEDVLEITTDGKTWVIVNREDLTPEQEREAAYYDQRGAELASWDPTQLLADLESGFDFDGLFGDDELAEVLAGMLEDEPPEDLGDMTDRAEELQEKWQVKRGDVWEIDGHLVICGDCREAETWERLLSAAGVDEVNGVFTSPPYAEQRKKQYGGVPVDQYVEWWEAVQENVRANLADDGSFFVNIKPHCEKGERVLYVFDLVLAMKRRWGWRFVDELCWLRPGVPGEWPNRFKNGFEPIFQFTLNGKHKFHPQGVTHMSDHARRGRGGSPMLAYDGHGVHLETFRGQAWPSNVVPVKETPGQEAGGHTAPFPITLPDFFIRAFSDIDDIWLDPFCGSGTVLVACHNNKRRGLGVEILPRYVAVILERLQGVVGLTPRLLT